jgi:hypothetical protein
MKADFFSIPFLESLPEDELDALEALCVEFTKFDQSAGKKHDFNDDYVEVLTLLQAFTKHRSINQFNFADVATPNKGANIANVINKFNEIAQDTSTRKAYRSAKGHYKSKVDHYSALFAGITKYEFSDKDYARIQILITELRDLIVKNTFLTEDHKSRLLKRLEAMQSELHKKTSDIDRFWGFIGEVGINIRKFGENMSPISERVQELGKIVIAVIYAKEGIPLPPEVSKFLLPDTKKRDEQK